MALTEHLGPFLTSQALIWGPLLIGHRMRVVGWANAGLARPLYLFNLVGLIPTVVALGIWKLDTDVQGWTKVPLLFGLLMMLSLGAALVLSPRLFRDRASVGAHLLCIPISNIGMGGFLTLLLLPAEAYPLNVTLAIPGLFTTYLIVIPLAMHWGGDGGRTLSQTYRQALVSPLTVPMVGILIGLGLNRSGAPMGEGWMLFLRALVYFSTALTAFAMGCRFDFAAAWRLRRRLRAICLMKFLIHPAIAIALCLVFGVRGMQAGVLFIAGCMPVAVMAVQFSTILDLDVDLASAAFMMSTGLFLLIVLPLMTLGLQLPIFQ